MGTILTLKDILAFVSIIFNKPEVDAILPYVVLPVLLLAATISRQITFLVMFVIGIGALYINSRPPRQMKRSPFFFSWTISSSITMIVVFETIILKKLYVTQLEHIIFLLLLTSTCFFFYKTKAMADSILANSFSKAKENSPELTSHYCQICQFEINERFFHSVWLDCCILRPNFIYFTAGQIFAFATLLYGSNIGLTSMCRPFKFYGDIFMSEECDVVYDDLKLALSFVTCVYGIGYLSIIALVCGRQLFICFSKYYVNRLFGGGNAKQNYQLGSQQDV